MRLVSCGSLPPTSPWPRMSVPPSGASISLPLAPPPSASITRSLRKSRRGFTSSILNQWSLVCLTDHSLSPSCAAPFVLILLWVSTACRTLCSNRISLGGNQQSSHFFSPLLGSGPHSVEAQHCGSCLHAWGRVLAHQLSPHLSRQLLLQNLRAPAPCENWPPHLSPKRLMSRGSPLGCGLSGWVSRRPSHITVLLAHFSGFHRHSQSL